MKEGVGIATLTGGGKDFTGPLVIDQGVLRVTETAVPGAVSGVSVLPGGQLRLVSSSDPGVPRIHTFGGGTLSLDGPGRDGIPLGNEFGVLGALRYDPPDNDNHAILTNPIHLPGFGEIHVDGTRNRLDLTGPLSGDDRLTKTGGGTLTLAADSPDFTGHIQVDNGRLHLACEVPADVSVSHDAVLSGSGSVLFIEGGSIELGGEILSATQSTAKRISAVLTQAGGAAGNGALRLHDAFDALPTAPDAIDLYLNPATPPVPGDRFQGGLHVPPGHDLTAKLAATTLRLFIADGAGGIEYLGTAYREATPADALGILVASTAEGETLEVLRSGVPSSYAQWRNLAFADAAAREDEMVSGPAAPDADGVANLLRYAFGLGLEDPIAPAMPRLGNVPPGFRFAFDPAKSDLAWIVRASPDLVDWSEVIFDSRTDSPPAPGDDGLITLPVPDDRDSLFLRLELRIGT